jgi:enoyl-CoA hydratase/carnithine racemase
MSYQEILYEVSERIATITLFRPDKLNAWTARMGREVRDAMEAADGDGEVRVIVLTGAGKGFCAGADMSLLAGLADGGGVAAGEAHALRHQAAAHLSERVPPDFQGTYSYFPSLSKPVIAAINGHAVGLGLVIALYCDLRFASTEAKFGTAFARRGLIAEFGTAWMLPRLIGPSNALDLLLSARTIGAAEALRMGLINRVLPADVFVEDVRTYARELATQVSPRSMAAIKQQVYRAMFQTLAEATESAEQAMLDSLQSEDFKEGLAHFYEKRAPSFTGR